MSLRKNTTERVPVMLFDSTGAPKLNIVHTDIKDAGIQLAYNDFLAPLRANPVTMPLHIDSSPPHPEDHRWFEVDQVKSPGLYHILIPASFLTDVPDAPGPGRSVTGIVTWSVQPAMGVDFRGVIGTDTIIPDLAAAVAAVPGLVWDETRHSSPPIETYAWSDRMQLQYAIGHVKITVNKQLQIWNEDDTVVLKTFDLKDIDGAATIFQVTERDPIP